VAICNALMAMYLKSNNKSMEAALNLFHDLSYGTLCSGKFIHFLLQLMIGVSIFVKDTNGLKRYQLEYVFQA